MKPVAVSPFLLLLAVSAQAQVVYNCKDASGHSYYTSQPPAGMTCKALSKSIQAPADAPAERKALAEKEMADRKQRQQSQDAAAKAEKGKGAADEKKQQCEQAKINLQGIESGQIRFTMGPNGERVGLDGAVRDAELAKARKAVDSWCK